MSFFAYFRLHKTFLSKPTISPHDEIGRHARLKTLSLGVLVQVQVWVSISFQLKMTTQLCLVSALASTYSVSWCFLCLTTLLIINGGFAFKSCQLALCFSVLSAARGITSSLNCQPYYLGTAQIAAVHVLFFFYAFVVLSVVAFFNIFYVFLKFLHIMKLYILLFVCLRHPFLFFCNLLSSRNLIKC